MYHGCNFRALNIDRKARYQLGTAQCIQLYQIDLNLELKSS